MYKASLFTEMIPSNAAPQQYLNKPLHQLQCQSPLWGDAPAQQRYLQVPLVPNWASGSAHGQGCQLTPGMM